jgi:hypothetical protein
MIISFSLKGLGPPTIGLRRIFIALAGLATLAVAVYRTPVWLDVWHTGAVIAAVTASVIALVVAIGVAIRGRARAVKRVAKEISLFGCALIAAEAILLLRAPENWPDDALAQRLVLYERVAREQGIAYDARLRSEVVTDLQSQGIDAVPAFIEGMISESEVASAIRERELLPLSNVANTLVVECNEGTGYLQFRSDQFGFNNPPGLAAGPVDVAVIGESLALGHCVPAQKNAVDRVRARFPRTANFGVAGSRVLSQLGVFREYVEPIEPKVVVWFMNVNFAEPRHEGQRPRLLRYLSDPSYSQGLRQRQADVDSLVRDVVVPLHQQHDRALRAELESASTFPLSRVIELDEVRGLLDVELASQRPPPAPDLSEFVRAVDSVARTARAWGGRVILVILPSYELSEGRPQNVSRYHAVTAALSASDVTVVDGVALFAKDPDYRRLYTLQMDNHPNELGHAMLGDAVVAAIESREGP